MKRIFVLTVSLLLVAFVVKGQFGPYNLDTLNFRNYESQYLLPGIMDNCADISLDVVPNDTLFYTYGLWGRGYLLIMVGAEGELSHSQWHDDEFHELFDVNCLNDYAQPFSTDTSITIIGISGYIDNYIWPAVSHGQDKFYLEIWDSTLTEVIRSVDVTNTNNDFSYKPQMWTTPHYTEVFFDSAINMSGKFYVVYHTPDSVENRDVVRFIDYTAHIYATVFCETEMLPLTRPIGQLDWLPISAWYYSAWQTSDFVTMLYLFPILGEYNPNAEEWHGVGLNETRDISQFTHVFPNPAKEEVNINCGYKIRSLQMFDEQGKRLFEKEVNAYNYQINLENYPTGTYLIKVLTNSGQTTKKVIKE